MAFRYVEGDFPAGTVAECKGGDWSLVLPKTGLFKAQERVALKGNVQSVEIIKAQNQADLMGQLKRGVAGFGGGAAIEQMAQRAGAAMGEWMTSSLSAAVGSVFGKKEVPILCVLCDGKFFLGNVSMKNFEWLSNQALISCTARRVRNADFVEAALALCALMTCSDGWIDGAKKARVASLFTSDETLKTFTATELEAKFAGYCRGLMSNGATGKKAALDAASKLSEKEDQARAALQMAVSLGDLDGHLDANEQKIVREACEVLGIYPGEFGLFYSK
ncbi:MAG TPA: TerB family tellurite resistance protein [Abditibacterium sp.]|jgi:tellurite resistance protein TerB